MKEASDYASSPYSLAGCPVHCAVLSCRCKRHDDFFCQGRWCSPQWYQSTLFISLVTVRGDLLRALGIRSDSLLGHKTVQ